MNMKFVKNKNYSKNSKLICQNLKDKRKKLVGIMVVLTETAVSFCSFISQPLVKAVPVTGAIFNKVA